MPLYFGIDLGTSNTVITCISIMIGQIGMNGEKLNSQLYNLTESVIPFYYEGYKPIQYNGKTKFEVCTKKESLAEYHQQIAELRAIRRRPISIRAAELRKFIDGNQYRTSMPSVVYRKKISNEEHVESVQGINQTKRTPKFKMYAGRVAREFHDKDREVDARIPEGQHFYENTKTIMDIDGEYQNLSPADISAELLSVCFRTIMEAASILNTGRIANDYRIGISYPVAQNGLIYRRNLEKAIRLAKEQTGLPLEESHIEMIQEPYAALLALHYDEFRKAYDLNNRKQDDPNGVIRLDKKCDIGAMVIDIGGGTTDVAVLPIRYRGLNMPSYPESISIRAQHRISHAVNPVGAFGGYDFDARIADAVAEMLDKQMADSGNPVKEHGAYTNWVLHNLAVDIKHTIGERNYSKHVNRYTSPWVNNELELNISEHDFNQMVMPLVDGTGGELKEDGRIDRYGNQLTISRIITQTLGDAGAQENAIAEVYVTGGMSKLPQIREMISAIWKSRIAQNKCHIHFSADPLGDISRGVALYVVMRAAYQHIIEQGGEKKWENGEILFKEMVPAARNALGLFADCGDGLLIEIIPCGSQLIVHDGRAEDVLRVDNALGVSITLYSGRSPYDQNIRLLGQYKKEFDAAHRPRIENRISLCYSVNQDMKAELSLEYRDDSGVLQRLPLDLIDISGQNWTEEG